MSHATRDPTLGGTFDKLATQLTTPPDDEKHDTATIGTGTTIGTTTA